MMTVTRRRAMQILASVLPASRLSPFFAVSASQAHAEVLFSDNQVWQPMWSLDPQSAGPDSYIAFRGKFHLLFPSEIQINYAGASWFVIWVDGEYLTEGPGRYSAEYPTIQTTQHSLSAGEHMICVQAHFHGVITRMLGNIDPFVICALSVEDRKMPIAWKAERLAGYHPRVRRINPELGWAEWCDTRLIPADWQATSFDDSGWDAPISVKPKIGAITRSAIRDIRSTKRRLSFLEQGIFDESYGYPDDDPPVRFFLRDLRPAKPNAQGIWRRYDVGKIQLGRPSIQIESPAGSTIEFAYSEQLKEGRVVPWITLSDGPSCNLDRYISRGGAQWFSPLAPRGGRYIEVHVSAPPAQVHFLEENYWAREYFDKPAGSFISGNHFLNHLWKVGIETLRSCSEDAIIDNPTRERGQWTGDLAVALDVSSCSYADLSLCKNGLQQAAQCSRSDGMIAAVSPGTAIYFPNFATQWINSVFRYFQITGDQSILLGLYEAAQKNMAYFESQLSDSGLISTRLTDFVDWGYLSPKEGSPDPCLNLNVLKAARTMVQWSKALNNNVEADRYSRISQRVTDALLRLIAGLPKDEKWKGFGYHSTTLALSLSLLDLAEEGDALAFLKQHILSCFPNNLDAPRLSDPSVASTQLITPYFAHYVFPTLIERGEMNFVLEQFRIAWGWMLAQSGNTLLEVFDKHWSHCHQWSSCPTWQLSRYALGLNPRFDLGKDHFTLILRPGSLEHAQGSFPLQNGKTIDVSWQRSGTHIDYMLQSPVPITLHIYQVNKLSLIETTLVTGRFKYRFEVV